MNEDRNKGESEYGWIRPNRVMIYKAAAATRRGIGTR